MVLSLFLSCKIIISRDWSSLLLGSLGCYVVVVVLMMVEWIREIYLRMYILDAEFLV